MAHVRSSTYSSPALIRAEWREVYKGQAIGGFDDLSDKPISDLFRQDRRWAPAWETLARERLFSPPKALRQHQILQRSLYLDSAVQPYTFYVEILATTIRAISGLSRQTPSLRIVKSAGIEHGRLDEVQDGPVDLRPLRFHEVENKFRRPVSTLVHYADGWVVAVGALSHCRAKTASGLRLADF